MNLLKMDCPGGFIRSGLSFAPTGNGPKSTPVLSRLVRLSSLERVVLKEPPEKPCLLDCTMFFSSSTLCPSSSMEICMVLRATNSPLRADRSGEVGRERPEPSCRRKLPRASDIPAKASDLASRLGPAASNEALDFRRALGMSKKSVLLEVTLMSSSSPVEPCRMSWYRLIRSSSSRSHRLRPCCSRMALSFLAMRTMPRWVAICICAHRRRARASEKQTTTSKRSSMWSVRTARWLIARALHCSRRKGLERSMSSPQMSPLTRILPL
mmetsp:Transcript_74166/g.221323  ORF Transcript_74166/g.221323 Transcript_74166/m.221323 type:complete len:268 (-) Transcript_74166:1688-2491(-)